MSYKSKRNCKYCIKEFAIECSSQYYCHDCKLLEFNCKCGCQQKIKFMNWIKDKKFVHGHNRRGIRTVSRIKLKPLKKSNLFGWCKICQGPIFKPQRKTCSRECFSELNKRISAQKWKEGVFHIQTENGGYKGRIKGCYHNGLFLRSSWELAFVLYLESIGWDYQYEKYRFDLGDCIYIPDFYIPKADMFIEIKGWAKPIFLEKMKKMDKLHPNVNLLVIQRPPPYNWVFE